MKYEYLKGSEKDFEGAPEWATLYTLCAGEDYFFAEFHGIGARVFDVEKKNEFKIDFEFDGSGVDVIAERRPITEPSWNGVGLPPVGCECEVKVGGENYNLCRVVYSDANAGVAFIYLGGDDEKYCGTIDCVTAGAAYGYFRPIRSEADKNRDAAVMAINNTVDASGTLGSEIYDAIASGKIPGVKLED